VERGTTLTVRLRIQDLMIKPAKKPILWIGEIGNAGFWVTVPKNIKRGSRSGVATILIEGIPVAKVLFAVEVGARAGTVSPLQASERRYHTAFASYASEDQEAVFARIHGMLKIAPSLDIFVAVANLRSGEHWQAKLEREIVSRDVMYLFWSKAASRSKWVDWEWRCGLRERGIDFIDPCPLAPPDRVPPPKELADKLHFNDWVLAYIDGRARQ
jgi:hypothetical protein